MRIVWTWPWYLAYHKATTALTERQIRIKWLAMLNNMRTKNAEPLPSPYAIPPDVTATFMINDLFMKDDGGKPKPKPRPY